MAKKAKKGDENTPKRLNHEEFVKHMKGLGCREFDPQITLDQLRDPGDLFLKSIRAEHFSKPHKKLMFFQFDTPKIPQGICAITLGVMDTYDITFYNVHGKSKDDAQIEILIDLECNDIYADGLIESIKGKVFDKQLKD